MLVVRVELHSAITHRVTEIAVMRIYNDGTGDAKTGSYVAETYREGTDIYSIKERKPVRRTEVKGYKRQALHVWNLVARCLAGMNYK